MSAEVIPAPGGEGVDPHEAFERDVPEHLREDAMQMMAEATGGWGSHPSVTILEHDRLDAINCRASGIIEIQGNEFTFQMEDGNWNGTVLLAWESDRPFEQHVPIRWALQPSRELVGRALEEGRGPFLILKWDAILKNRPDVAAIPDKYSYDRYVQPGGKVESHWKQAAAKHHFEIVTEDEAKRTRKRLAA
jgi:hypothetical protein